MSEGEFGLASSANNDGNYERLWYAESVHLEEVAFEPNVFLLTKARAKELKLAPGDTPQPPLETPPTSEPEPEPSSVSSESRRTIFRLSGSIPPDRWNLFGTKILPRLRDGDDLTICIDLSASIGAEFSENMVRELQQTLHDLGLEDQIRLEKSSESKELNNDK